MGEALSTWLNEPVIDANGNYVESRILSTSPSYRGDAVNTNHEWEPFEHRDPRIWVNTHKDEFWWPGGAEYMLRHEYGHIHAIDDDEDYIFENYVDQCPGEPDPR